MQLRDNSAQKVSDTVHVSLIECLSLSNYIIARRAFCDLTHNVPCVMCERMLVVAQIVSSERYCSLRRHLALFLQKLSSIPLTQEENFFKCHLCLCW